MNGSIQKLRKEDIKKYIQEFISGYRRFLEEEYPDRKNEFGFYTGYPFEVKAYLSDEATLFLYKYNSPSLTIDVAEVEKIPDWRPIQKEFNHIRISSNVYLSRRINKAQDDAVQEILGFFSQEAYEEEQAELYNKQYYEEMEAEFNQTVDGYINYLDKAYEVKKITLDKHRTDIYYAIQLIDKYGTYYSGYLMADCEALADVIIELNRDIESSIFLIIHANYRPANSLLRRWLETTLIALFFDFKLKKYKNNPEKYNKWIRKRDLWLRKSIHISLNGNGGVFDFLIDSDTNNKATQLLKLTNPDYKESFEKYVETIYTELNKHVHYGGRNSDSPFDELPLDFVEYNEKRFTEWYNKLNQINEICNIIILLKFPEMISLSEKYKDEYTTFPTLEESQSHKLKELLKL